MNNLMSLYTTTDGRIGRQQWWIGIIVLIVINIVISFVVGMVLNVGANMQAAGWVSLVLFLIFAYPIYCLYVKRRHDRDNSGLDALIFLVVLAISVLMQALGMAFTVAEVSGVMMPQPTMLYSIVGLVVLVYGIYMLVVMGFLKGTPGPNQYGPDPLGGGATATA